MAGVFAYIDCQNLHRWTTNNWWEVDWEKLYKYLVDKFKIDKAYMFIGLKTDNLDLYNKLSGIWYTMKLRKTVPIWKWQIKGNIDWDLIVQCMIDLYEDGLTEAYIFTSDGDFNTLVQHLKKKHILWKVLTHDINKTSMLLKKAAWNQIQDLSEIKDKICK